MKLRDYQRRCVGAIIGEWVDHQSTLIVVPTGGGKTQIFSEIVRAALPGRSLVLVHREELVFQARARIEKIAGIKCEIEMAEMTADLSTRLDGSKAQCVIASVQTIYRRLAKFDPKDFAVVIADEAHHSTAATWKSIIEHFKANPALKILGVTATPDRSDEEALGQIFETVAFEYEILDAIHDGWLVPVEQQMVHVGGLDFSAVRTTAGDLNGADLAAIMESEKNLQGMVGSSIEIIGDKPSILFASSVKHAEMACEIFNRHRPEMAAFICGKTDRDTRRDILASFLAGKTQVLCNVGIATEGFDAPAAAVILNGRPTKSRALYAQIAGRALRPLPGLVDGLDTPEERRAVIAASAKPCALIVDFVGNSGKHKLIYAAHILGGKVSDEAVELALTRAKASGKQMRMVELLEDSEKRIAEEREEKRKLAEARKARLVARVNYSTTEVNPFDRYQIRPQKPTAWDAANGRVFSEKQRAVLQKMGVDPASVSFSCGKQLIGAHFNRGCSEGQAKVLRKHGYPTEGLSVKDASAIIQKLADNGWKRPPEPPAAESAA